jgi:hypothetical protein
MDSEKLKALLLKKRQDKAARLAAEEERLKNGESKIVSQLRQELQAWSEKATRKFRQKTVERY